MRSMNLLSFQNGNISGKRGLPRNSHVLSRAIKVPNGSSCSSHGLKLSSFPGDLSAAVANKFRVKRQIVFSRNRGTPI